jgi:hypothetical protein
MGKDNFCGIDKLIAGLISAQTLGRTELEHTVSATESCLSLFLSKNAPEAYAELIRKFVGRDDFEAVSVIGVGGHF